MSQQINLYEAAFRQEKTAFSAAAIAGSLAAIALAFAALHFYLASQVRGIEAVAQQSDKAVAALRGQVTLLVSQNAVQGAGGLLAEELVRSEARLKSRREILQDITTRVAADAEGYSALMTGLARRTLQGVWLTGFSVGDDRALEIKGGVLDPKLVPAYVSSLNDEVSIRGRDVTELVLKARAEAARPMPAPGDAAAPAKGEAQPQRPLRYVEFTIKLTPKGAAVTEAVQ
jgi:hypothetical protein